MMLPFQARVQAAPAPSGRSSQRGGARGEPRPGGEAVAPPTGAMAGLAIGTGDASGNGRPRKEMRYTEPKTRPAHIVSKQGKKFALSMI